MPDLEKQIAEWRQQMAAGGIKSSQLLDELESHLREEIARQKQSNIEPAAVFQAAVERIGDATQLNSEFKKAVPRKHWWQLNIMASPELERKLGGACIIAMGWLIAAGMSVPILFKLGSCSGMSTDQQFLGLAASILIGVPIACGRYLHPFLPALPNKRMRTTAILAGSFLVIAWVTVLFYAILPRVTLTESQLLVAILWAMVPWAVIVSIFVGIEEATRRRNSASFET